MTYQENLMGKIHKVFIISLLTYVLNSKIFIWIVTFLGVVHLCMSYLTKKRTVLCILFTYGVYEQ